MVNRKANGTKKCIIKRELMFENYKDSLFNGKDHNIDLEVIITMCTQKRLIKQH